MQFHIQSWINALSHGTLSSKMNFYSILAISWILIHGTSAKNEQKNILEWEVYSKCFSSRYVGHTVV